MRSSQVISPFVQTVLQRQMDTELTTSHLLKASTTVLYLGIKFVFFLRLLTCLFSSTGQLALRPVPLTHHETFHKICCWSFTVVNLGKVIVYASTYSNCTKSYDYNIQWTVDW